MKKILSAVAVSVFVITANQAIAGGTAPSVMETGDCPEGCQKQISGLNSSQASQDEQIAHNFDLIQQNRKDIDTLMDNPWYVKGIVSWGWTGSMDISLPDWKAETDTSYGFGAALGRQFGSFRVEGELASQKSDLEEADSGDIRIDSGMINGFYDVPVYGAFSLYGMLGMGAAKVDISVQQVDDSEVTFAYRTGMGVAYAINQQMAVDFGYEYLRTGDIVLNQDLRVEDIKNSNLTAAFRYSF